MPTWIAPKTFVAGDYLTFTELNGAMGDNGDLHWLKEALHSIGIDADSGSQSVDSGMLGCRLLGAAQEIQDSVWTALAWSEQRFGKLDGADFRFLVDGYPTLAHLSARNALTPGYYMMGGHISWAGNTTGRRGIRIASRDRVNLSTSWVLAEKFSAAPAAGTTMDMSISTAYGGTSLVGGGDSIVVEVYQDSGDTLGIVAAPGSSPEMWIARLGVD